MKSVLFFALTGFLFSFNSFAVDEDFNAESFYEDFNIGFENINELGDKLIERPRRSIASVDVSFKSMKRDFFKNKWTKYSKLNEEVRVKVLDMFAQSRAIIGFDEMIEYIKSNKKSLTKKERVKMAELRGQYEAFLMWN